MKKPNYRNGYIPGTYIRTPKIRKRMSDSALERDNTNYKQSDKTKEKHSIATKNDWANMTKEERKTKGQAISKGINSMSPEKKKRKIKKLSEYKGERSSGWKGGRYIDWEGYIHILIENKETNKNEYVKKHRWVMEQHLGRKLKEKEVVHHINKDLSDNRIENLQLFKGYGEHTKHHWTQRKKDVNQMPDTASIPPPIK